MLSAPAAIPAMIAVSFPAGLTPAEGTFVERSTTLSSSNSDRPDCSAKPITGTRPAHDTKRSSSNTGVARDHASGNFTSSALSARTNQELDTAVADRMATRAASLLESADLAEATEILAMDDQMDQIHRDLFTAVVYTILVNILGNPLVGHPYFPTLNWWVLMLLVVPSVSVLVTACVVWVSARVSSYQSANSIVGLAVLPLILLVVGQATGVMLLGPELFAVLRVVLALLDILMMRWIIATLDRERVAATLL